MFSNPRPFYFYMPRRHAYYQRKNEGRCVSCNTELSVGYTKTRCSICRLVEDRCRRYGITLAELQGLIRIQGNRCAICRDKFPSMERTFIDHDHATGEVRGLLCPRCNTRVGVVENVEYIERVKHYLLKTPYQDLTHRVTGDIINL